MVACPEQRQVLSSWDKCLEMGLLGKSGSHSMASAELLCGELISGH